MVKSLKYIPTRQESIVLILLYLECLCRQKRSGGKIASAIAKKVNFQDDSNLVILGLVHQRNFLSGLMDNLSESEEVRRRAVFLAAYLLLQTSNK